MCGIIGVIGKEGKVPVGDYLNIMKDAISHRGPDGYGEHIGNNLGFANLRLAIVDVAGGKQPIYNEDKSVGIVYNGEIYNYNELKSDLEKKGHKFKTKSDTEVALRAYEEYGTRSFDKLNGMFSLCIWDDIKNIIYLVRDPIGMKPLYFYEDRAQIIFCSEIKGILEIPGLDLELDPRGFEDYLMFRYVQGPYTLFKKIRRMEAGTYLEIKASTVSQFRYWDVSYGDPFPKPEPIATKKQLLKKIEHAVESHLMGEVPVGVLLSGGLDSSVIAYLVKKTGANLKTFNIGFKNMNEFKYSSLVAKNLGLEHIEILMTLDDIVDCFDEVIHAMDEPIEDPACFPLYFLGKELKKHVTVVLSGEGGDELFGGYPQYKSLVRSNMPHEQRFNHFLDESYYFRDYLNFFKNPNSAPLVMRYKKYFEEQPLINGMLAYDIKTWMPENLMMKADKILMAHSLEGRFPFLDKSVFEFVAQNIPQNWKIDEDFETKRILKDIMKDLLPSEIINRKKMGFSVPVDKILYKMKNTVIDIFEKNKSSEITAILDIEKINKFAAEFYSGKSENALRVWNLFILSYWFVNIFPKYQSKEKSHKFENINQKYITADRAYIYENFVGNNTVQKIDIRNKLSGEYIKGNGIEIGAWYSPLSIPRSANVKYIDLISEKEHKKSHPNVKFYFPKVDIIDDGEILSKIEDRSQNFIIANHFLEHAKNALGTIRVHLSKLKEGGVLYYAIPNKDFTFDCMRGITKFEHIVSDDLADNNGSDFNHYLEWTRYIDKIKGERQIMEHAKDLMVNDQRIHFHVWNANALEEFFLKTKKYLDDIFNILHFTIIDNEVIVILKKK